MIYGGDKMPPRIKITKDEIVGAAVELVRNKGFEALNARDIAASLKCSTQPIFSNFSSMDELMGAVIAYSDALFEEYVSRETESGKYPAYKASGMAYIRFAKEEKELFKLLYMRDRTNEVIPERTELGDRMESMVHDATGLEDNDARLFHLEMWAYVHGIATMLATGFFDIDMELVSKIITDVYSGLRMKCEKE